MVLRVITVVAVMVVLLGRKLNGCVLPQWGGKREGNRVQEDRGGAGRKSTYVRVSWQFVRFRYVVASSSDAVYIVELSCRRLSPAVKRFQMFGFFILFSRYCNVLVAPTGFEPAMGRSPSR